MTDKNLGHATAYGYAKSKGYTGTEEEFAELMASYADVAESAKGYAEQAEASATNAETSETNARASASTASTKASEASTSASTAQTSASNAQTSATSASTSASSASASAQTASTKASEASDSATSASESASTAVSAKDDAVTAKEQAETAKADAETAAEEAQESAQTVANKADKDGTYPDMTVGGVMSSDGFTDSTPYLYRVSGGGVEVGKVEEDSIVGGTVAWNQLCNSESVTVPNGHKYLLEKASAWSVGSSTGTAITGLASGTDMLIDLTQMFGSFVADYIYSLEQSSTGSGVAFFRKLFPKDYYEYNTGELMSVEGVSAHVMRDVDDNIIGNYPLDSSLTLRGIPKLDSANNLYYDGDVYSADGKVQRKFGVITLNGSEAWGVARSTSAYGFYTTVNNLLKSMNYRGSIICNKLMTTNTNFSSEFVYGQFVLSGYGDSNNSYPNQNWIYIKTTGDFSDLATIKSWLAANPITVVYELATPTTESAEPYESIQKVSKYGTEEYVSSGIVPVGHVTKYPTDIVAKVNGLPSDFSTLIAPTETGFKASRAYSVNQFLIVNNQLYRVTASIANGATITVGTNVVATTVADILTALLNA